MSSTQNDFPQPANARPPAPPADQPARPPVTSPVGSHQTIDMAGALRSFTGQESFVLDPDVRLALEDLCQAAEGRNWKAAWPKWLNEMINESIRGYLGR
jgi:hypothetical protein